MLIKHTAVHAVPENIIFLEWGEGVIPISAQDLIMALHSEVTPAGAQRNIGDSGNGT